MSTLSEWQQLEELVTHGGQVTIGKIHPIECAAIAGDGRNMLAALQRRDEESLAELLQRLEWALNEARTSARVTNEIKRLR